MEFEKFGRDQTPVMGMSYEHMVSRGGVRGAEPIAGFGESVEAGAVNKVLWGNGTFAIPPVSGIRMEIKSSNAADANPSGTGVRSIEFHYLDADLNIQVEIKELDGINPVLTDAINIRFVQSIHIVTAGSASAAVGNISFEVIGGGQIYGYILAGDVRDASSARMVPAGKRLMFYGAVAGSASGTASASTRIRAAATQIATHQHLDPFILIPFGSMAYQDNSFGLNFPFPIPFEEGTVVALTYESDKGATVSGTWFGILEEA